MVDPRMVATGFVAFVAVFLVATGYDMGTLSLVVKTEKPTALNFEFLFG